MRMEVTEFLAMMFLPQVRWWRRSVAFDNTTTTGPSDGAGGHSSYDLASAIVSYEKVVYEL